MSENRIDALLEEAISAGAVPESATAEERAELEGLLDAMSGVHELRSQVLAEADAATPIARARFQRHLADSRRAAPASAARARSGRPGRLMPHGRVLAWAGSAAGVALVLALAAIVTWQVGFQTTESAYAQMVEPGDYVQVEGIVQETGDGELALASALGKVDVEAGGATVMGGDQERGLASLEPGDQVLISGVAGNGRRLVAQTIAASGESSDNHPDALSFRELRRLQAQLEGEVISYTISRDGSRGAVLLETADGRRYLVPLDGPSAARLLEQASTALGQRVMVTAESEEGRFGLDIPPEETAERPGQLAAIRGVIASAQIGAAPTAGGGPEVMLTVQTLPGPVEVRVRETAQSFVGASGLPAGPRLLLRAVGHTVSITGGLDAGSGQVVADALVLGPRAERQTR